MLSKQEIQAAKVAVAIIVNQNIKTSLQVQGCFFFRLYVFIQNDQLTALISSALFYI